MSLNYINSLVGGGGKKEKREETKRWGGNRVFKEGGSIGEN